jgi:hypothetical protein
LCYRCQRKSFATVLQSKEKTLKTTTSKTTIMDIYDDAKESMDEYDLFKEFILFFKK